MRSSDRALAVMVLERLRADSSEPTAELLAHALDAARATWGTVELSPETLCAYLVERIPVDVDISRALAALHLDDLYLCCGCLAGDPTAQRAFQQRFTPVVEAALLQLRLEPPLREELRQKLLVDLMVDREGEPPLLAKYGGIGGLSSWLRVVTTRAGRKALRRERRLVPTEDRDLEPELLEGHVELPALKQRYRLAFKEAFKEVLGRLELRDANLLRYRYLDGMGLDQIGAIERVHASTVHRWLEKVRTRLLALTHDAMAERLDIPKEECATIIRMIGDDLEVSLRTFFKR